MLKLAYIDEVPKERRVFQRYCERFYKGQVEVITPEPQMPMEEFVISLIQEGVNAVIADYDLQDEAPELDYRGNDLVEDLLAIKNDFPIFLLTNHEPDAENDSDDLNIIYSKKYMYDMDNFFIDRVVKKINKYKQQLEKIESEFEKLNSKKNEIGLDVEEESKFIELGISLEGYYNNKRKLPKQLVESSNIEVIDELIENTKALLNELSKENSNE